MTAENNNFELNENYTLTTEQLQEPQFNIYREPKNKTITILIKGKDKYIIFKKYFMEEFVNDILHIKNEYISNREEREYKYLYTIELSLSNNNTFIIVEKLKLFSFIIILKIECGIFKVEKKAIKIIVKHIRNYRKRKSVSIIQKYYKRFVIRKRIKFLLKLYEKWSRCCNTCCRLGRNINRPNYLTNLFCSNSHPNYYLCFECCLRIQENKCPMCRQSFEPVFSQLMQHERHERRRIPLAELKNLLSFNTGTRIRSEGNPNTFFNRFQQFNHFLKEPFKNIIALLFTFYVNSKYLYERVFIELKNNIPKYFKNYTA